MTQNHIKTHARGPLLTFFYGLLVVQVAVITLLLTKSDEYTLGHLLISGMMLTMLGYYNIIALVEIHKWPVPDNKDIIDPTDIY